MSVSAKFKNRSEYCTIRKCIIMIIKLVEELEWIIY